MIQECTERMAVVLYKYVNLKFKHMHLPALKEVYVSFRASKYTYHVVSCIAGCPQLKHK